MQFKRTISLLVLFCLVLTVGLPTPIYAAGTNFDVYYNGSVIGDGGSIHYTGNTASFTVQASDSGFNLYYGTSFYSYTSGAAMNVSLPSPSGPITITLEDKAGIRTSKVINFYKDTIIDPGATLSYVSVKAKITKVDTLNQSPPIIVGYDGYTNTGVDRKQVAAEFKKLGMPGGTYTLSGELQVAVFVNGTLDGYYWAYSDRDELFKYPWGDLDTELRQRQKWSATEYIPVEESHGSFTVRHKDINTSVEIASAKIDSDIVLPKDLTAQPVSVTGYKSTPDKYISWYGSEGDANSQPKKDYISPITAKLTDAQPNGYVYYYYSPTATPTPTPAPTPPPVGSKPTLGIDASPKSVNVGQSYTVVDKCGFAAPATGIASWTVTETFKAKGSSTETFIFGPKTVTNASDFFKSYTKTQEGEYTYYIARVDDNKGNFTEGMVSVTVKVEAAAPTPTPTPSNKPPVAEIISADEVMAGDDIDISTGSYDPDGYITDYYWSAPQAQKPIIGFGSTTWFDMPGNVSVYHRVTDNYGATDSTSKIIKVLPPIPKAQIDVKGRLKENYKITVDSTKSVASKRYPIDHTKTKWVITAVSGCTDSDIKYLGGLIGMAQKDFLVKKAGRIKVTLTVTNTLGQSDTTYTLVDVAPNLPPVAQLIVPSRSIREYIDGQGRRYGETTVYDTSYSPDGDKICRRKYYYRFDSDNDGNFDEEALELIYEGTAVQAVKRYYNDQGVGWAMYDIEVEEDLMEQDAYGNYINTIPEFITPADIKKADTFHIK